jgi:excinuclease UvrABC nuclease subunit
MASSVGMRLFGMDGSKKGDKDQPEKHAMIDLIKLQVKLQDALDREQFKRARRFSIKIEELLSTQTDRLVQQLSAAANELRRELKKLPGHNIIEKLANDMDAAVNEQDFGRAATIRDTIRKISPPPEDAGILTEMDIVWLQQDVEQQVRCEGFALYGLVQHEARSALKSCYLLKLWEFLCAVVCM